MAARGVGLAVPIETVARRVSSIIENGHVARGWLGAAFAPDSTAKQLGLDGAMVLKVVPGGPAQTAGLRPMRGGIVGDTIVRVEGRPVLGMGSFLAMLEQRSPGDKVGVTVRRPKEDSLSEAYD